MKKVFAAVTAAVIMTACLPGNVSAGTGTHAGYEINDIGSFRGCLQEAREDDGKVNASEKKDLLKETDPAVVAEFTEEKIEKVFDAINELEEDAASISDKKTYTERNTVDLGDGCSAVIEIKDEKEKSVLDVLTGILSPVAYAGSYQSDPIWKNYGNRYSTADATFAIGIGVGRICLENHYKLHSGGITERYGIADSWLVGTGSVDDDSPVITDKYATKPGKSNVNMRCKFKIHVVIDNIQSSSSRTLKSTINYLKINKTKKEIKIQHKWESV